jgi:hypothetical protein
VLIAEDSSSCDAESCTAHSGGIRQLVSIHEFRIGKYEFVGGCCAKGMREVCEVNVGGLFSARFAWIWDSVSRLPPDRNRVLVGFVLVCVGSPDFGVVTERIRDFAGSFPPILGGVGARSRSSTIRLQRSAPGLPWD